MEKQDILKAKEEARKELEELKRICELNRKATQETFGDVTGFNIDYDIVSKRRRFSEWVSLFLIGFMLGILVTIL